MQQSENINQLLQGFALDDNITNEKGEYLKCNFKKICYGDVTGVYAVNPNFDPFADTLMKLVGVIIKNEFYSCGYCYLYGMNDTLTQEVNNFTELMNNKFNEEIWHRYSNMPNGSEVIINKTVLSAISEYKRKQLSQDAKQFLFGNYYKTEFKYFETNNHSAIFALFVKFKIKGEVILNDLINEQIKIKSDLINFVTATYDLMVKEALQLSTDKYIIRCSEIYKIIKKHKGKTFKVHLNVYDKDFGEVTVTREGLLESLYNNSLCLYAFNTSVRNEIKYFCRRNKHSTAVIPLSSISSVRYGKEIICDRIFN